MKIMTKFEWCFILSMPRSGSTLLTVLLDKGENCVVLPETHFFDFYEKVKNKKFADNKSNIIKSWISYYRTKKWLNNLPLLEEHLEKNANTYKDLFEFSVRFYLLENNINSGEKVLIIEKSPPHMYFQKDIASMFPNSKAIYLVRDPRAVIASLMSISWSTHNIFTLSKAWNRFVKDVGLIKNNLMVKYEDLVTEKEIQINKIYFFLDIREDEQPSQKYSVIDKININNPIHSEVSKPVNDKNIGKWKTILSSVDLEADQIEKICKKGMNIYEYERVSQKNKSLKTNLFVFLHATRLFFSKVLK